MTVDALFDHAGVIRIETVGEQFDVAELLARQPLPAGGRVAVVTNAGGPAIACVDACAAAGLRSSRSGRRPPAHCEARCPARGRCRATRST